MSEWVSEQASEVLTSPSTHKTGRKTRTGLMNTTKPCLMARIPWQTGKAGTRLFQARCPSCHQTFDEAVKECSKSNTTWVRWYYNMSLRPHYIARTTLYCNEHFTYEKQCLRNCTLWQWSLTPFFNSLPVNLIAVTMSTCVKTKAGVLFASVRYKLSIFAAAQEIKQMQSIYVVL